jgi:preprotein translocase subunit Sss1
LEDTWSKAISDIQNEKEEYISKKKNCLEWAKKFEWDEQLRKIDQYLD